MLGSILPTETITATLEQQVLTKAQGNPFFLEEIAQMLVDQGALRHESGRTLSPTIQLPATVQAVLAARIDRLPPEAKALLQTAAVIGPEVPLALLQAIAERPEAQIRLGLTHLQGTEFLYETRLFPEHEYAFKHALTHEVAYSGLVQDRRRTLHGRIVEALEALAWSQMAEQVDRLAHHALRGEVWDKALVYCRQAGEKAMARSAHREAVGYLEQALSALTHLPEQRDTLEQAIDLRLALRSALRPLGDFARVLSALREAETLASALDDPRRLGQVLRFLANHFHVMGAYDQATASAQRALVLATASGDVVLHALATYYLGEAHQT
jgi:predicted ATPase